MSDGRKNNKGTKGNNGGNPGYGQMVFIRNKVKKYCPQWWKEWDKMIKAKDKDLKKFAMQEFNKLQVKMVPQDITSAGEKLELGNILDACEK